MLRENVLRDAWIYEQNKHAERCVPAIVFKLGLSGKRENRTGQYGESREEAGAIQMAKRVHLFAFVGFFEFAYLQFTLHTKHSSAHPISFSRVWITHHDVQAFRHNLPGQTIFVLEPAT